jgi:1-acyl-sn-glycerol-3-phosphate acyltransferase
MLPPRPVRRLVLTPLVIVIAASLAVLTPLVALLSAVVNLVRRPARRGRARGSRALRMACLALVWSVGEIAALTVLLCLWIASGFGGRLGSEAYQARHYGIMRWFLDLLYRAAQRACGLRVVVSGPACPPEVASRPVIVLCRHAGPADSLLLVRHLLSVSGRRPRVVLKASLQLDPSVDVVGNRVPNAFVRHRTRRGANGGGIGQVRRLAAGLDARHALVIFPEGGNWTPLRWRRAIAALRQRGDAELARRAAAMPNLLPPRTGGALAALAACPDADVIFVAHTGLDRLVSVRDIWHSLLADMEISARWWHVASADVPRAVSHEARVAWLYDWWERLDAWITAVNAGADPVPSWVVATEVRKADRLASPGGQ